MMRRTAIHPGEHLAEELQVLGISAAALGRQLKVPTNRVTEILNGQRAITGDTALRLAHFFGTSTQFWLNLQGLYELRVAQMGNPLKAFPRYAPGPRPLTASLTPAHHPSSPFILHVKPPQ